MKNSVLYSESLCKRFKSNKIPHAAIIETSNLKNSQQGLNKMLQLLMCKLGKEEPCGNCEACVKISLGSHPDVKLIGLEEKSQSIKVESIRWMRQDAHILPSEQEYKFYVISPADALTPQAQNAFIKILEEPPRNVIFILICESLISLLDTVVSRCEIFRDHFGQNDNKDREAYVVAKKLSFASFNEDKLKILEIISKLPLERSYIKNVIDHLQKVFLEVIKEGGQSASSLVKKIDKLAYISDGLEVNTNINLALSNLMVVL